MKDKNKALKALKNVLREHDLSIGFTCSDCSDTHGLYDDEIIVHQGDTKIAGTESWWLTASDIKEK